MKLYNFVFSLLIFGVLFWGCDKTEPESDKTEPETGIKMSDMKNSNLGGVRAVFATGSSKSKTKSNTEAEDYDDFKWYKVGIDDQTQTVTFTDDEGNSIPVVIDHIQNLSSKYAFMRVYAEGNRKSDDNMYIFIIRKSDGKLFTTPETFDDVWRNTFQNPLIFFKNGIFQEHRLTSDREGNVYYPRTFLDASSLKIHEKNGNTTITIIMDVVVEKGCIFNDNNDHFNLWGWLTADGQWIKGDFNWSDFGFCNYTGLFALSSAPNSFFQMETKLCHFAEESVLVEYFIRNGRIVREEVRKIPKLFDYGVLTTGDGIGVALVNSGNRWDNSFVTELCIIKDKSDGGITYIPFTEDIPPHTHHDPVYFSHWVGLTNHVAPVSNRYIYGFVWDNQGFPWNYRPRSNRISRLDPQTGTIVSNYYTLPSEYVLEWVWVTSDDILTILSKKDGRDVYIEVNANGVGVVHDVYNGEDILFWTAF